MEVTEVDGVAVTVSSNSSFKSCELILDCGLPKTLYKSRVLAVTEDPMSRILNGTCFHFNVRPNSKYLTGWLIRWRLDPGRDTLSPTMKSNREGVMTKLTTNYF